MSVCSAGEETTCLFSTEFTTNEWPLGQNTYTRMDFENYKNIPVFGQQLQLRWFLLLLKTRCSFFRL